MRAVLCGSLAWAAMETAALPALANEPRAIVVDSEARPIQVASSSETTRAVSAAPLRWRSKGPIGSSVAPTSYEEATDGEQPPVTLSLNGPAQSGGYTPRAIQVSGQMRAVAQTNGSGDPFRDPFGDQGGAAPDDRFAQGQGRGLLDNAVGPDRPAPPSYDRSDIVGPPGNRAPFDPSYAPELPDPGSATAANEYNRSGDPACRRVYNDRDCCDVDATCRAFVQSLMADSIANVSLDITPRYMPDIDPAEEAQTRVDRLRLAESREWRNRNGQVLAVGKLGTLANGRVIVVNEQGREVAQVPIEQLGDDERCFIAGWWRIPAECALAGGGAVQRNWMPSVFAYQASGLCHKPLYFEEVQLERYGHTTGSFTQPFVSGAHFFASLATLPYQMAISPPTECEYALGYYRPGSCAPWHIPPIPFSVRGGLAQAGFVVGGVYLIP
jgi:hypothetical protein